MTTGQCIKAARKKSGMTQEDLGAKLSVSGSMIAQYETDKRNPKMETLMKLSFALDTPLSDLIGDIPKHVRFAHTIDVCRLVQKELTEVVKAPKRGIENQLIAALSLLNDEGQHEAVKRVEELTEIPRYRAETAPESPPAPQEGKDTPAPEPPSESAEDGE